MPAYFWGYYALMINLISVLITIWDKNQAARHRRRIPEKTLMLVAALGGSPGMYLTMHCIRHKTKHKKFMLGIPAMMLVQAAILYFITVPRHF